MKVRRMKEPDARPLGKEHRAPLRDARHSGNDNVMLSCSAFCIFSWSLYNFFC